MRCADKHGVRGSLTTQPHFTTLSDFISRSPEAIADLFGQIVLICDELGLIGKERFAIQGYTGVADITAAHKAGVIERMKHQIDSAFGRHVYSQRLGAVDPVFGHLTEAIGIKRFSRQGRKRVDKQWKLMMLDNILKIHRYGWEWA